MSLARHDPTLALAVALLVALGGCHSREAERREREAASREEDELITVMNEARLSRDHFSSIWKDALTVAPGHVVGRSDLGPCPIAIPNGTFVGVRHALGDLGIPVHDGNAHAIIKAEDLPRAQSPRAALFGAELAEAKRAQGKYEGQTLAQRKAAIQALGMPAWWTWDVILLIDKQVNANGVDLDGGTFNGGYAVGRAYVFDYAKAAIVCAGEFGAGSSNTLHVRKEAPQRTFQIGSGMDLDVNAAKVALESLHVAGPPVP